MKSKDKARLLMKRLLKIWVLMRIYIFLIRKICSIKLLFQCSDASIVLILLLHDSSTADQRDDQLAANSMTARNYIEDMDLFIFNQDHRQL